MSKVSAQNKGSKLPANAKEKFRAPGPGPVLEEKQSFFTKAASFVRESARNAITEQLKLDLVEFAKISLIAVPSIAVFSAALVGTDMLMHGRIMPGISLNNNNLGFKYGEEAAAILQNTAENFLSAPITVTVNGAQTQVTPRELGVEFSLPQNYVTLPVYDFRKDSMLTLAFASVSGRNATTFMTLDAEKARNVIEQKLDLKKLRAQNAHLNFDDKKKLTVAAEVPGKVLDSSQLVKELQQTMDTLHPQNIALNLVDENPSVTAQNLESRKDLAAAALKDQITLLYGGQKWKLDPSKHLDAITFTQSPTVTIKNINMTLPVELNEDEELPNDNVVLASNPGMAVDGEKMNDFLETEIIAKIDHPTSDVKIFTDAKKNIVIEGKGQDGVKVSRNGLLDSLTLAFNKDVKRVEVPAIEEKARVSVSEDLQSLGIKNLIATGHTAFVGSHPGRIKNIEVGISRYNGLLVQPGETFSFNDHLGPVDGQHGFVQELVIKAEGTVPDYGGGLCQVSSTLYQAALFAGFPIVERANHSYAVSYYAQVLGYGLDGTIYPGVHDVKFLNNSPAALVVQAYTEGTQAYFKFYGTDDDRKVWLEGPYQGNYRSPGPTQIVQTAKLPPGAKKQVEINHTGFDVTWYRHIVKNNAETKETLFTRYDAVPAKIMVGADTATAQAVVPKT